MYKSVLIFDFCKLISGKLSNIINVLNFYTKHFQFKSSVQLYFIVFKQNHQNIFKQQLFDDTLNLVYDVAMFKYPQVFEKITKSGEVLLKCLYCDVVLDNITDLTDIVKHMNTSKHKQAAERVVSKTYYCNGN